jgi:hypothetical protein
MNVGPLFGPILCTAEPALKSIVSLRRGALYRCAKASERLQNGFLLFRCEYLCSRCDVLQFTRDSIAGRSNRRRAATNPRTLSTNCGGILSNCASSGVISRIS